MMNDFERKASRAVAIWVYTGVFMLLVQVVLGGVTRLTGSGLSITEWDLVTGFLPPLNHHEWLEQYNKYRQTPQFQLLNFDFTLSDFKFIFFWEWFHRLWARLIAVVFVLGFAYLVFKKYLRPSMQRPLIILFLFGAFQGVIGWIMVKSGLSGDATFVKPTRLALHLIFALGLIAYAFWFALRLSVPAGQRIGNTVVRQWTRWLLLLLFIQLLFGALMAGHKAALFAPTWPDINGRYYPEGIWSSSMFWLNFIENKITIHFIHRNLAYGITLLLIVYFFRIRKVPAGSLFRKASWFPLLLVLLQVTLGIGALLFSLKIRPDHWGIFEWTAQLHQITGMLLMLSLVALLYLAGGKSFSAAADNV